MSKFPAGAVAACLAIAAIGTAAHAAPSIAPSGIWRNPKNSVHIRIQPCGENVCGTVVWANDHAREKARKAGTPELVGTQLFQEFREVKTDQWGGRVFVPDMQRTVSGTLRSDGPNALVARGCILGGIFCKSQVWTRLN